MWQDFIDEVKDFIEDFIDYVKYNLRNTKPRKFSCKHCKKESYSITIMLLHLAFKHKKYYLPNYRFFENSIEFKTIIFVFTVLCIAIKALLLPFAVLYEIL